MTLFLSLLAVWAILLVLFGEADTAWPNLIATAIAVVVTYIVFGIPFESLNVGIVAVAVGVYFLIGLGYSLLRWNHFVDKVAQVFYAEGKNAVERRFGYVGIPPEPSRSKGTITNWVMWWPASILHVAASRLIFIADWVGPYVAGFYSRISNRKFDTTDG